MTEIEGFDAEEVHRIVIEIAEKNLGEKSFKTEKLKQWTDSIVREVLEELSKLEQKFKYIVTCAINQRTGGELFSHSSCFFNADTDTVNTYRWENKSMYCIISIYAMGLE